MADRIIVAGFGNFGQEVACWLKRCRANFAGFIDDEKPGELGSIQDFAPADGDLLLVAISNPKGREKVVRLLTDKGAKFTTMGADCVAANTATWGEGTMCCPMSVISHEARIGRHVHINIATSIGHHVHVGDYCTFASHVDITGHVSIGERSTFGSGSRVLPGLSIGNDCVIGAGAIVVNDVPDGVTMYAQPARSL